jgi:hypothetical protein
VAEAAARRVDTPWLTTSEAADYCRMSETAIRKHIYNGTLVPDSWGGRGRTKTHRFKRETLDRFLEE